jgi:hypothetical protein
MEPTGLDIRRAIRPDIEMIMGARHAFIDVTVTHPTTYARLADAVREGMVTSDAARRKRGRYEDVCKELHAEFIPAAFATYGELGKETIELLKFIATYDNGASTPVALRWNGPRLISAVSVAIQRGNAVVMRQGLQSAIAGTVIRRVSAAHDSAADRSRTTRRRRWDAHQRHRAQIDKAMGKAPVNGALPTAGARSGAIPAIVIASPSNAPAVVAAVGAAPAAIAAAGVAVNGGGASS